MPDFTYDVLITYARADGAWVHKTLLPRLKTEGLRIFDEGRDLQAGASRAKALEQAARASENVLFVLTPDYVGCAPPATSAQDLTPDILARLRETLLRCGPFEADRQANPLFVDARLAPWRYAVPWAGSAEEKVAALIDKLSDQRDAQGGNALALFLRVLAEQKDAADQCHLDLARLADELSGATASRSADPKSPYADLSRILAGLNPCPRLLPLLKADCALPPELADLTPVDFTDAVCADAEEEAIAWRQLLTALGAVPVQDAPAAPRRDSWFLAHPYPMPPGFTGRADERRMLTDWLDHDSAHPLLVLRALGGFGKSALTWHWLMHDVDPRRWPVVVWWSFYETESSFESFLIEVLEYLGVDARQLPPSEQVRVLLSLLYRPGILLILDGFERALRAYSSMGAAYQGDDEGSKTQEAGGSFQPTDCVSPLAEAFLRAVTSLPGVRGKVLITTRLTPRILETRGGWRLSGCREEELTQLAPADAAALFRAVGVRGSRAELEQAGAPYGYHPLSLRLLAGLALRDLRQPGDIAAVQSLDISGELVQRQHHVLEQAYTTLPPDRQTLLSRIACFRGPVAYEALSALGKENTKTRRRKGFKNSASLRPGVFAVNIEAALHDLIARGLLHRDASGREAALNRYDLHPIVRRYAYDRLTVAGRADAHAHLRDYFAAVPTPERVQTLDDLAPVIELYHHTVRAEQLDEAATLFRDRLTNPLYFQFGAYQSCIELLRALFPDPSTSLRASSEDSLPRLKDESAQAWTLNTLAASYSLSGQPRQAVPLVEGYIAISEKRGDKTNLAIGLGNVAQQQLVIGALRAAEANLRRSIALCREIEDAFQEAIGHQELGRLLAYRGAWDEADDELATAEAVVDKYGPSQTNYVSVVQAYRALRALLMHRAAPSLTLPQRGREGVGVEAAQRALELADETARTQYPVVRDYVDAHWLLGAAYRVSGDLDAADRHLSEALTRCRGINMVDHEADILLELAKLRKMQEAGSRTEGDAPSESCIVHPESFAEAKRLADEALVITERAGYVLQGADVHLFLAQLALEAGDRAGALEHARQAHTLATCDGEPYVYRVALDEAKAMLEL